MERASDGRRTDGTPFERIARLEWDMDVPPGSVAAYLIEGPEPILVDAGPPGADGRARLEDGLAARGYGLADVAHVVITHPHTDHAGQVGALVEAGARLYAPAMAVERFRRDPDDLAAAVRETARAVGVPEKAVSSYAQGAVDSLEFNRTLLPPAEVDVAFPVGEPFDVGDRRFEPIHVPGHERTQTCFAVDVDGRRALFAGDGLVEPFRPAALHAGLDREAFEAVAAFYAGLDRLAGRDVDRTFPGHGPVFADHGRVVAETRGRLDGLVAEVAETLGSLGAATPNEVAIERGGVPDHPGPLLDVVGAVGYLDREGRATWERDGEGPRRYTLLDR